MSISIKIASRYLFSHHKFGYISFISIIAIIGLAVGVAALILTIAILNGFENEIKTKLLGFDSHIRLRTFYSEAAQFPEEVNQQLQSIPHIKFFMPYIHGGALIRSGEETEGVIVEGVEEEIIEKNQVLKQFIREGEFHLKLANNNQGIVIGKRLAKNLNVNLGDEVYLFIIQKEGFLRQPRFQKFIVTGLYSSGIYEYDDIFVFTHLEAAQRLFNLGNKITGYQILLDRPDNIEKVKEELNKRLGYPYYVLTWYDLHANLFDWLHIQKYPIMLIFGLIALVALFNIVSSLMMIVFEKTRDIGILKSLGMTTREIKRIFLYDGLFIGIGGVLLGSILAFLLGWLQNRYSIISLPADVYFIDALPVMLRIKDFIIIGVLGILAASFATLYPAHKAANLAPSEAVRYE